MTEVVDLIYDVLQNQLYMDTAAKARNQVWGSLLDAVWNNALFHTHGQVYESLREDLGND